LMFHLLNQPRQVSLEGLPKGALCSGRGGVTNKGDLVGLLEILFIPRVAADLVWCPNGGYYSIDKWSGSRKSIANQSSSKFMMKTFRWLLTLADAFIVTSSWKPISVTELR
jgi:hypothetical protein